MTTTATDLPVLQFFPYQLRWIDDHERLKIVVKCRQTGLTFIETWDIISFLLCNPGQKWFYLSISEDRAASAIEYAQNHCDAIGIAFRHRDEQAEFADEDGSLFSYRQLSIAFPNGSQLVGLPANPRTARGCSGNVTLDEFAHHHDADRIWTAVSPIITWGYRLHVISTPNGMQGRFYRIWTSNERAHPDAIEAAIKGAGSKDERLHVLKQLGIHDRWSRHFLDVYQAHAQGHPIDIGEQREIAGDELTWLQEYCGKFLDEGLAVLPYELIAKGYDADATHDLDLEKLRRGGYGPLFGGYDVARKRDLSVLWINERLVTGQFRQAACITLKQSEFEHQEQLLHDHMRHVRRLCIDGTGIGAQLGETMVKRWGESRVEVVQFSGSRPAMMVAKIRKVYEATPSRMLTVDDPDIRRDFHSVRREHTDMGAVRYTAPRGKDGHADRFWAACLALEAADQDPGDIRAIKPIGPNRHGVTGVSRYRTGAW